MNISVEVILRLVLIRIYALKIYLLLNLDAIKMKQRVMKI